MHPLRQTIAEPKGHSKQVLPHIQVVVLPNEYDDQHLQNKLVTIEEGEAENSADCYDFNLFSACYHHSQVAECDLVVGDACRYQDQEDECRVHC